MKRRDLTGQRFGYITVISFSKVVKKSDKAYNVYWNCKDDFGFTKEIASKHLVSGQIISCGGLKKSRIRSKNPRWTGIEDISGAFFYQIRRGAEVRNLTFEISLEDVWKLYLDQDKKCALSKTPISFNCRDRKRDGTASLDRIDSSKGYVVDNIQWVHKNVNKMKQNLDESIFIEYCKLIAENN